VQGQVPLGHLLRQGRKEVMMRGNKLGGRVYYCEFVVHYT
jgi:hypothetical protein